MMKIYENEIIKLLVVFGEVLETQVRFRDFIEF